MAETLDVLGSWWLLTGLAFSTACAGDRPAAGGSKPASETGRTLLSLSALDSTVRPRPKVGSDSHRQARPQLTAPPSGVGANCFRKCGVSLVRVFRHPRTSQSLIWLKIHPHSRGISARAKTVNQLVHDRVGSHQMERVPPALYFAGFFLAGVLVGYAIRAFISARRRAGARRGSHRHDFEG